MKRNQKFEFSFPRNAREVFKKSFYSSDGYINVEIYPFRCDTYRLRIEASDRVKPGCVRHIVFDSLIDASFALYHDKRLSDYYPMSLDLAMGKALLEKYNAQLSEYVIL